MPDVLDQASIERLAELEADGTIGKLQKEGITWFSWSGVLMFKCPHCNRVDNENAEFVYRHTREHGIAPPGSAEEPFPGMEEVNNGETSNRSEQPDGTVSHGKGK